MHERAAATAVEIDRRSHASSARFQDPLGANRHRLRFQVLRSIEDLSSLKTQWDALWAETGAEYYLRFSAIQHSWNRIHRPQGAAFCCAVVVDDGELLGVLPMILRSRKLTKTATSCGPGAAEGCGMLIKKSAASGALATALLKNFLRLSRPDYLQLDFVNLGSDLEIAVESLARRRVINAWDEVIPRADLRKHVDWQSYKSSLSRNYQTNTARKVRRLNELGKVAFEVVSDECTALIAWIFRHKQQWSERTNKKGGWVFSKSYQEYLTALMSSDRKFFVYALKLDESPIAASMVAIDTRSASGIITTYDEKYKRYSPGSILTGRILEHIFESCRRDNGERLDFIFGPGKESFKLQWSCGDAEVARSYSIVTSNWGLAKIKVKRAMALVRSRAFLRKGRN